MSLLHQIRARFATVLSGWVDDVSSLMEMIRPAQDARFGDYQVNCAMPLKKVLGKPPREIAEQLLAEVSLEDLCSKTEIAGPGFINLTISDDWLKSQLTTALQDERLGIVPVENPRKYVIDFSSPNVAKPMHVGHIRSTVIGDALTRLLRFLGHEVISDNHLGDWGTQFGMIIYGYKHFGDAEAYRQNPIAELTRLYRLVRQLMDYHEAVRQLPDRQVDMENVEARLRELSEEDSSAKSGHGTTVKQQKRELQTLREKERELNDTIASLESQIALVEEDPKTAQLAEVHAAIGDRVLEETAKLHAGDLENRRLWEEFMPKCREDMERIYRRLGVTFDFELGESFYQEMLSQVVESLEASGLAELSDGAVCVFVEGFETPMIIRKKDGAYLYATTDLATIKYRMDQWNPDALLYVVDHRQAEHFDKLFAVARKWGYDDVEFTHVMFGTVLGEDRRAIKTRAGTTVALENLLDEAVRRAAAIVEQNDEEKPGGAELSPSERQRIAEVVGIGALKYVDLCHNRTSDYVFSFDKMVALKGNTATYLQYSYARVQGIFRRGGVDRQQLRNEPVPFEFTEPVERELALKLVRFSEVLREVPREYKPNLLTQYLYELTETFFQFYNLCPVKDAPTPSLQSSRYQLCDQVGRTIELGLSLLGIGVVDRM